MNRLVIKNLSKKFKTLHREVTALKKINLTVESGEFFVLLGPSGCGKSTLLNIIAGLEHASQGEIIFGDTLLSSVEKGKFVPPGTRNVAMVFQNYALYPHMSVSENIEFPLKIRKIEKTERKRMVDEAARMLSIDNMLDAKPGELSGGQRQRVAIARAVVRKPDIFLLDEPLSNLDAQLRASTRNSLKSLQKRLGVTTIYVTHDQVEAMTLGDRVALLKNGTVEQVGSPNELYQNPKNTFVGGFIGSPPMNIIETDVYEKNGKVIFRLNETEYVLPERLLQKISKGEKYKLGIRPEHICIFKEPVKDSFPSKVSGIERLGRETVVFAGCNLSTITLFSPEDTVLPDEKVYLRFDMSRLYVFRE